MIEGSKCYEHFQYVLIAIEKLIRLVIYDNSNRNYQKEKEIRCLTSNSPVAQSIDEIRLFLKCMQKLGKEKFRISTKTEIYGIKLMTHCHIFIPLNSTLGNFLMKQDFKLFAYW